MLEVATAPSRRKEPACLAHIVAALARDRDEAKCAVVAASISTTTVFHPISDVLYRTS